IPLTGDSISGGGCLRFLTWIVDKPTWELQLVDGSTNDFGEHIRASFDVQYDGVVTWMEPGMPNRRLRLTGAELDTIRRLDRLSCRAEITERAWERRWMRVALAGGGGATIPQDTQAARAIDALMTAAQTRYLRDRRVALGPIDITLSATGDFRGTDHPRDYRIHITGARITIARGKRTIATLRTDPDDLVKLVDWTLGLPMHPTETDARGTLCVDHECRAIAFGCWEQPLFETARVIDHALVCDAEPESMHCH